MGRRRRTGSKGSEHLDKYAYLRDPDTLGDADTPKSEPYHTQTVQEVPELRVWRAVNANWMLSDALASIRSGLEELCPEGTFTVSGPKDLRHYLVGSRELDMLRQRVPSVTNLEVSAHAALQRTLRERSKTTITSHTNRPHLEHTSSLMRPIVASLPRCREEIDIVANTLGEAFGTHFEPPFARVNLGAVDAREVQRSETAIRNAIQVHLGAVSLGPIEVSEGYAPFVTA